MTEEVKLYHPFATAFPSSDSPGLTKLEYMATHIAASLAADPNTLNVEEDAVAIAKKLLFKLNEELL